MTKTVRARVHHGADSLDLTLPADTCRENDIRAGDIFEISIEKDDKKLRICYNRVYRAPKSHD